MTTRYAQDAPYWNTTKSIRNSSLSVQREMVLSLLERWGVRKYGWTRDGEFDALYFELPSANDEEPAQSFKLSIRPLEPQFSERVSMVTLRQRAQLQAWRMLYHHLKTTLEFAWWESPERMLLPWLLLLDGSTLREIPAAELRNRALPAPEEGRHDT